MTSRLPRTPCMSFGLGCSFCQCDRLEIPGMQKCLVQSVSAHAFAILGLQPPAEAFKPQSKHEIPALIDLLSAMDSYPQLTILLQAR